MSTEPDFRGMTANERLFAVGLDGEFDAAVRRGDRAVMAELLGRVGIVGGQASVIIHARLGWWEERHRRAGAADGS